jgi:eukaryotic-like serine/threonine-protein kinase
VPCLDPDTVLAFVDGRLTGAALAAAEEHVAACQECEALLTVAVSGQPSPGSETAPPLDALPRGAALGRYVVLSLAGRGAMGAVYEAYDTRLECKVALKLLREQAAAPLRSDATARLLDEAKKLARISHRNVIAIRDAGQIEGRVFISMEFVDGETLSAWLQAKPRSWRQIREIFVAAGRGLEAAHQAGLVHRDFKPQNVMVGKDGAVRVTDFGLASDFQSQAGEVETALAALEGELSERTVALTETGVLIGTPLYMAPEQFEGELARAPSDQFSFCVALYHALYGEWPFPVPVASFRVLREAVRAGRLREPPARSQVPTWLRKILVRGLDVDPSRRFPSMAELLGALEHDPARPYQRFAAASAVIALAVASAFVARWSPGPRRRIDDAATIRATNEGVREQQTAFHTALATGRDDVALASATALEMAYGSQLENFQEADRWDQLADALLRRLGTGHEREAIELSRVRALLEQRRGPTPRSPSP